MAPSEIDPLIFAGPTTQPHAEFQGWFAIASSKISKLIFSEIRDGSSFNESGEETTTKTT